MRSSGSTSVWVDGICGIPLRTPALGSDNIFKTSLRAGGPKIDSGEVSHGSGSPVNGLLGLWHDRSESPGREEDRQVLRYVVYSRCQVKHFAPNLHRDYILEIHADPVLRPRLRHGVAERTEIVNRAAGERHDLQSGLAVQGGRHADEPLDVRGDRLVRLTPLDNAFQRHAGLALIADRFQLLDESDDQVPAPVGEGLDLALSKAVDAPDDPRLGRPRL